MRHAWTITCLLPLAFPIHMLFFHTDPGSGNFSWEFFIGFGLLVGGGILGLLLFVVNVTKAMIQVHDRRLWKKEYSGSEGSVVAGAAQDDGKIDARNEPESPVYFIVMALITAVPVVVLLVLVFE